MVDLHRHICAPSQIRTYTFLYRSTTACRNVTCRPYSIEISRRRRQDFKQTQCDVGIVRFLLCMSDSIFYRDSYQLYQISTICNTLYKVVQLSAVPFYYIHYNLYTPLSSGTGGWRSAYFSRDLSFVYSHSTLSKHVVTCLLQRNKLISEIPLSLSLVSKHEQINCRYKYAVCLSVYLYYKYLIFVCM